MGQITTPSYGYDFFCFHLKNNNEFEKVKEIYYNRYI